MAKDKKINLLFDATVLAELNGLHLHQNMKGLAYPS